MKILSTLPKISRRSKKRLGRGIGSGKGSKSGRGITRHQKSRTKIPLHFEGGQARLVKKYPLLRGKGKNKSVAQDTRIIDLEMLNKFKDGSSVDRASLLQMKLIDENSGPLKILANGQLKKKLTVKLPVSQAAKKQIEAAGGKVISQ